LRKLDETKICCEIEEGGYSRILSQIKS